MTQTDRNYLALGLPDDISFSHKFGTNIEEYIFADSGIVYLPNRPYVITVLYRGSGKDSDEQINEMFQSISHITYDFFKNQ